MTTTEKFKPGDKVYPKDTFQDLKRNSQDWRDDFYIVDEGGGHIQDSSGYRWRVNSEYFKLVSSGPVKRKGFR